MRYFTGFSLKLVLSGLKHMNSGLFVKSILFTACVIKKWVHEIDQDMNMWNLLRESRNIRNWFRYETFIYLFEFKVFRHEERETQFLSMLTFPSDPHHVRPPPQTTGLSSASSENWLASCKPKSQPTAFFQIPKSSALPGMTSFTSPVNFLSGVFIVTLLIVTSAPPAREHLHSMCSPN